ncbi:MAG: UbiA prenyltransferase [Myxococcales bacterium]|nr:UbiA prenyltransferase [Myxococcales bacterium]
MKSLIAFIRLGRPLFLGGGFLLYAIGAVIAAVAGHSIDWQRYALGQGAVTAFQLMTHYANDYFDFDADRANLTPTKWSGGSRVLAGGELPRAVALVAAIVLAATGIALTAILSRHAAALTTPTLALVLVLAWEYSAPPLRLCATGLGELDTAIVVTVLVPWLGFYLQAPDLRGGELLALSIVPLALLQLAMLVAIEFPDAAGDAATNKRTLVVRLGAARGATLYVVITIAAYAWPLVAAAFGLPLRVALAALVPAPIAVWRIARIRDHADPAAFERLTFFAVFLLVATSAAELVAWISLMNSSTAASS